jgi:flavin reductase (DIM6/NTAB) family NADH-FMN oxidoreductase RutF
VVSGDELRTVLRSFPSGICVVTIELDGARTGLTVGSLVSLSLEPADQESLAQHFARSVPPIALWTGVELREDVAGPPLLAGALGWLRCRVTAEHPTGDHTFFVGGVEWTEPGRDGPALVYVRQGYHPV